MFILIPYLLMTTISSVCVYFDTLFADDNNLFSVAHPTVYFDTLFDDEDDDNNLFCVVHPTCYFSM